eukprot:7349624-Lingulodinium_polyedra.AAC.1
MASSSRSPWLCEGAGGTTSPACSRPRAPPWRRSRSGLTSATPRTLPRSLPTQTLPCSRRRGT